MTARFFSESVAELTAASTTKSNSESVDVDSTLAGQKQPRRSDDAEDRSTRGLALPAVPPATVREPHADSYRVGVRWNCKPEISNAQDSSVFTRRRMSTTLPIPFLLDTAA